MHTDDTNKHARYLACRQIMPELWEIRSEDDRVHTVDLCEKMVAAGGNESGSPLSALTHRLQDVIATYERTHAQAR